MNRIPFPAKPQAETSPKLEFEPYYQAEPAPPAPPVKATAEPTALDTMYAYYDAARPN